MIKNFRLILDQIDVQPLLQQLSNLDKWWGYDDSWTFGKAGSAIYSTDNIVLRYNKSTQLGLMDWDRAALEHLPAARRIINDVMKAIPGVQVFKIIITRLRPGETIAPHIDKWPPHIPLAYHRYQIPLSVKDGVIFRCGDEALEMKPGECWWFDNQQVHSVENHSSADRISMLTDISNA